MSAYRIDTTDRGQFQVRVRQNPGGEALWFDAGDPCDTRTEAEAKMAAFQDEGTPCRNCGTTAVACQHIFRDSDQRSWCCELCQTHGARQLHREGGEET